MAEHPIRSVARYRPDISLGNILTVIGMSAAVVVWGLRLEGRVDAQERVSVLQQQLIAERIERMDDKLSQQKADTDGRLAQQKADTDNLVVEIKATLRRIEDKLDNKADKAR